MPTHGQSFLSSKKNLSQYRFVFLKTHLLELLSDHVSLNPSHRSIFGTTTVVCPLRWQDRAVQDGLARGCFESHGTHARVQGAGVGECWRGS